MGIFVFVSSFPFCSCGFTICGSAPLWVALFDGAFFGKKYALRAIVSRAMKSTARDILVVWFESLTVSYSGILEAVCWVFMLVGCLPRSNKELLRYEHKAGS